MLPIKAPALKWNRLRSGRQRGSWHIILRSLSIEVSGLFVQFSKAKRSGKKKMTTGRTKSERVVELYYTRAHLPRLVIMGREISCLFRKYKKTPGSVI